MEGGGPHINQESKKAKKERKKQGSKQAGKEGSKQTRKESRKEENTLGKMGRRKEEKRRIQQGRE